MRIPYLFKIVDQQPHPSPVKVNLITMFEISPFLKAFHAPQTVSLGIY
jgi:hypothetical protein